MMDTKIPCRFWAGDFLRLCGEQNLPEQRCGLFRADALPEDVSGGTAVGQQAFPIDGSQIGGQATSHLCFLTEYRGMKGTRMGTVLTNS